MRIRQIKPSFWTDATMARLSDGARLFYIGLWCLADDAGWLEWHPEEMGAELFPYARPKRRLRHVLRWAGELTTEGRVEVLDCGHAVIATLTVHQRLAGPTKQVKTTLLRHQKGQCPLPSRASPHIPETERNGTVVERNGKERKGTVAPPREPMLTRLADGTFEVET